jgi:mRNA interferase RelE/StbE
LTGKKSKIRFKILVHSAVPKEIESIPKNLRQKIKNAITSLSEDPIPVGSTRIRGRVNAYRIRISDYRIIYEVHATEIVVYIVGVAHRREVYRRVLLKV